MWAAAEERQLELTSDFHIHVPSHALAHTYMCVSIGAPVYVHTDTHTEFQNAEEPE